MIQKHKRYGLIAAIILVVLLLFRLMYDPSPPNKGELLLDASIADDLKKVQQLINEGVDPNYQGSAYGSALLYAAGNGHTDIVRFLLEKGASIDIKNGFGSTPLMAAAMRGHDEAAQLLLEKGADLSPRDATGETAYQIALRYSHLTTAALIAKYCPNRKCE